MMKILRSTARSQQGLHLEKQIISMKKPFVYMSIPIPTTPEVKENSQLLFFENGKCAKIPLSSYSTNTRRKKLNGAYSNTSILKSIIKVDIESDVVIQTNCGRTLIFNSLLLTAKTSRMSQGVQVIMLKPGDSLITAYKYLYNIIRNKNRYYVKNIPSTGTILHTGDLLNS